MVTGVFGLTGAGKSTFLAWCARRAQKGRRLSIGLSAAGGCELSDIRHYDYVLSSFPLKGCYQLDFSQLGQFGFANCLVLIDEISLFCDSRDWKNFDGNAKYFFTHHRHWNTDVVWCSQGMRDCDLRIRNLSQQFLYIQHKGAFTKVTPLMHCMAERNGNFDDWFQLASPLGCRWIRRKPLYNMFDSYSRRDLPKPDLTLWEV